MRAPLLRLEGSGWVPEAERGPLEGLSLDVPIDDGRPCPSRPLELSQFGAESVPFPEGVVIEGAPRSRANPNDARRYFHPAALDWLTSRAFGMATK